MYSCPQIDARGGREAAELARERRVHLRGRALEEATAAGDEERVAGEHRVLDHVGDGAERVAGDVERADLEPGRAERLALLDELAVWAGTRPRSLACA